MRAVTIKEAKAHLNELVDAAVLGEQVVIMRGSKHVAAIVPVCAEELELPPRLTDAQVQRFWKRIAEEKATGSIRTFASADNLVKRLAQKPGVARKRTR